MRGSCSRGTVVWSTERSRESCPFAPSRQRAMVDTRRKPFGELSTMQKLTAVIIPTLAAIWSIFGGAYSFSQATLAYNTLSSTAADVFSMAANFESTPIVDATLSNVDCAALADTTSLPWEGRY